MITRAFPLLFVTATAVSAGGQPPDPKGDKAKGPLPVYTAFPDLKQPADGKAVELPPLPTEPAGATPLQKVQFAQLKAGMAYLTLTDQAAGVGRPNAGEGDNPRLTTDVYRLAGDLETDPAKRALWYEARVRYLKGAEALTRAQAEAGILPPQRIHVAAFARLEAEADLLKLKAEAKK